MSTDNEEKNVTESIRKERFVSMEKVMTLLYCRHVFHDFRKPVEVMYPHLAQAYHSVVKRPMDLGTLLIKSVKKEILTIEEFRTNLQLVHKNALLFNEGAALMEAMSKHLELFSQGLFEEAIKFPYFSPQSKGPKSDFNSIRLEKRRKRFLLIRDQALTNSEMQSLFDILGEGASYAPLTIEEVLNDARADIAERQAWNTSIDPAGLEEVPVAPSLRSVLSTVIASATEKSSTPAVSRGQIAIECFCSVESEEMRSYGEQLLPRVECQQYLAALEDRVAELAVQMEERLKRGTAYSSIWAAPASMFVYAQSISMTASTSDGRSRSPWWPCMIIASDSTHCTAFAEADGASNSTSNTFGMQAEVVRANLERIPADIMKQLNKLRPRTANVAAATAAGAEGEDAAGLESAAGTTPAQFVVPEGYLLLEYFGAHDFGWVKAEAVAPMYSYTPTVDGSVYIGKNAAPGKMCNKDIVAEAAEAWSTLQKQRRREGLYRRSTLPPPALDSAMDISAGSSAATTEEALSGTAEEEEDINFASSKTTVDNTNEALSQDSDSEESDQFDLTAPPSLNELEESVDIPFPSLFESVKTEVPAATHSAPAKSSNSRSSNGRSRKSLSTAAEADDNGTAASATPSTYYVPGPRKGSFVPATAQNGIYFAPEREERRLYYATPDELMRFRASVEYVLPEDVTLEDFKNCVEEGKFKTSRCPLPLPTMQGELDSPCKAPLLAGKDLKDEMIIVDAATQATFRPKALLRTRALSYYLGCVRPLHLEHYTATPSKKGFPALPPTLPRTGLKSGSDVANSDTALLLTTDTDAQVLLAAEDPNKAKKGVELVPVKPEKRKYVFKNRPLKTLTMSTAAPTAEEGTEHVPGEPTVVAPSLAAIPALPPISAANIHVPANLTLSASCFLLDAGCSRYAVGDGSVYTRSVNTDAKVFHMEAKTCVERKRILRDELASLQGAIDALQQVSQQRQLRENERKIRFQQLQQQQMQQQLHQQQYAMQQRQHHQQYLMQLIDQQHQMEAHHLHAAGTVGAKKGGGIPRAKALKPMVPVAGGAASAPKPRSRPVVVFNAAGNPTIVRTTAVGGAVTAWNGAQYASSTSSEGGEGQPVPFNIPAPRKKSRLGDIDLSKATILTAQQHAAEQPKHPHKRAKVKVALLKTSGDDIPTISHLGTPPTATNALDFLASVAMESNDAPVRSDRDDLAGYKRSFGSISSPPASVDGDADAALN